MIEIPASLVERLRRRQVVLVAGLGCSELAGAPGWSELALRLADRIEDETRRAELKVLVAVGRRAAAIEYLSARLPHETIAAALREAYPRRPRPPEAIAELGHLPWRGVISTGIDGLWRQAGPATGPPVRVFGPDEGVTLAEYRGRFLWHPLGSSDAPDGVALGAAQARRLVTSGAADTWRALAERDQCSFVFVGYKPGDPDLLAVKQLAGVLTGGPHLLFVAGARELETDVVEAELGVTAIAHSGSLEEALRALHGALAAAGAGARPTDDDVDAWLAIWKGNPADPEPREMLERAEARLRAERRWQPLVALLLARIETGHDRHERVELLRSAGQVYGGPLGAAGHAYAAISTAFRLDPDAKGLLAEVKLAAAQAGRWRELAADYAAICGELGKAPTAVAHRLELARIYAEELKRPDEAVAQARLALEREPRNLRAARLLPDLLGPQGRWAELGPALALLADVEEDPARARDLRLRLAELQATRLAAPDEALATYERVLAGDLASTASPMPTEALDALERGYRRGERWAELARVLDARATRAAEPDAAARIRRERADLLSDRLDDPAGAIADLEAVVAHDPEDRAALRALEALYEKSGRDVDSLRTLERLVHLAASDGERLLILRRLASEWESKPDGLDHAAVALDHILKMDPLNGDASRALARVYRQAKRWPELIEALTRQMAVTDGSRARGELWAAMGVIYDDELREEAGAAKAFRAAVALGDDREATVAALARHEQAARRWPATLEALETLSRVAREPAARVEALMRAAELAAGPVGDASAAEGYYARVLEIEPTHAAAATALSGAHRARHDLPRAARLLREAESRAAAGPEKARLLYELGALQQDELDDTEAAAELFRRAVESDPEQAPAAERLVPLLARDGRWDELDPLLQMLARKSAAGAPATAAPSEAAAEVYVSLGQVAARLGRLDTALCAYEVARQRAPDSGPVLRGFGELRAQRGEWREAEALYRALADGHHAALTLPELIDIYGRLGRCQAALGDREAALEWYGKCLAVDGPHQPALDAMAALHAEAGDYAGVVADKRALLALARDDETRLRLSDEIGDLLHERLDDVPEAVRAYQAALALAPGHGPTLHRLIAIYTKERRWREAALALVKLADLDDTEEVKAKYLYAAAVIYRDELGDADWAVALFNRALDHTPDMTMAFDAVERLLAEAGAWKQLARNYRKMIERLPAPTAPELRLRLWSALGEVSLVHLGDMETAVTALEVAATLDDGNAVRHEQLAEVYLQAGADHADKAIAEHQWLIAHDPDRLTSYRALAELYAETGALDKLWCVAGTLSFIRKADAELERFYEQNRPREPVSVKRAFNEDVWEKVVHPDEDRFMTAVFVLMGHFVAGIAARQHKSVGLERRERVDVGADERLAARVLRYVADTLELPPPDLFIDDSQPGGLNVYNLQEKGVLTPALVVGRDGAKRDSRTDLTFEVGKRLALLRPERFVRYAVASPSALDIAVRAALTLAGSGIGSGVHNGAVDSMITDLRRLVPRPVTERLAVVARKLVAARGEVIDAQGWMTATDLTAARVGFVLTTDLKAAARVISSEPAGSSPLTSKQRLKDLLAYSVSESHFAVRKLLGLKAV